MIFLKVVEPGTVLTERALIPVYPEGTEKLAKIKNTNKALRCDIKRARSPQHHRKLWALLKKTLDNQDQFKSEETLLDAIKIEVGHAEMRHKMNGETYWEPKSISFHSMGQDEFNDFYKKAMAAICEQWGFDPETLQDESDADLSGPPQTPVDVSAPITPEKVETAAVDTEAAVAVPNSARLKEMLDVISICQTIRAVDASMKQMKGGGLSEDEAAKIDEAARKRICELHPVEQT